MSYQWFVKPPEPCPCCKRAFEPEKIGNSAIGWAFGFEHTRTEDGWRAYLADKVIVDETGRAHTPDEFWEFVDGKAGLRRWGRIHWI